MVLCLCRDAADLVVQGKGKFEELMVCSHEIAASTAQLVAASKVSAVGPSGSRRADGGTGRCDALLLFTVQVKADKDSGNLHRLQQASRGVTQATAKLVASTKSGKSQIEEKGETLSATSASQISNPVHLHPPDYWQ